MRIHNVYADDEGRSRFRTVEVEWEEETKAGRASVIVPAVGLKFREVPASYRLDWHPAPRRQFIINLDAGVRITTSDGAVRTIGAGEILLVEDTTGCGHLSEAIGSQLRHCVVVMLE